MLRVFIGYDNRERIAYHVLSHSILKRSSIPTSITPLNKDCLRGFFSRPRGPLESTDFSISRFLVPFLCDYEGYAVFMDCDMLCQGDIAELAGYMSLMFHYNTAVRVVKHEYQPTEKTKFLGNIQTQYEKKNWSSVMLMNTAKCRALTPEYVNTRTGLELHRFRWLESEDLIGEIPHKWNHLVDYDPEVPESELGIIHFTEGGPYFENYRHCGYADLWRREYRALLTPPQPA
jgi:lipopolysaccharide biosynthesis glycosyltransferase